MTDTAGTPEPRVWLVPTPVGNLGDITLRAVEVLRNADAVACEDTRRSGALLTHLGIRRPLVRLDAHTMNRAAAVLEQHPRLAYVSDAGTPGISDPGARLVAAVRAQNLRAVPLPGASSITTLVSVAGLVEDDPSGFVFVGFLPSKAGERDRAVLALATQQRAVLLLEAPHRIEALALALATLGARALTIGRELTKQFEEIATVSAQDFPAWLAQDANRLRGEFALILHALPVATDIAQDTRVLKLLLAHFPLKTAVKLAADITGEPRNGLYQAALALKSGDADQDSEETDSPA